MTDESEKDYYLKKKGTMMRQFDVVMNLVKNGLIEKFNEGRFNEFALNSRKDFEMLIHQIPYIGGKTNRFTENLINATSMLALMTNLEKQGLEFHEIGELCYNLFETFFKVMPSEDIFQEEYIHKFQEDAKDSMLRKYPEDWIYEFIKGDGKAYDYGIDFIECGIYHFFKKNNAEYLVPLMCIVDYVKARASGYELKRTQTIARGDPVCDFCFIKGGTSPRGWPLENLKELNMK